MGDLYKNAELPFQIMHAISILPTWRGEQPYFWSHYNNRGNWLSRHCWHKQYNQGDRGNASTTIPLLLVLWHNRSERIFLHQRFQNICSLHLCSKGTLYLLCSSRGLYHKSDFYPQLRLLTGIYDENNQLLSVDLCPYHSDNSEFKFALTEPHTEDGESYRIMLWDTTLRPVINPIREADNFFE